MNKSVLKSWNSNAKEWNTVIDGEKIPSRKFTNEAIVKAIASFNIKTIADFGCGEGWLCRKMTSLQIESVGFDGSFALIEKARQKGDENYVCLQFEEVIKGKALPEGPFDGAVFNFSIYQKEHLDMLLKNVLHHLNSGGILFIQTLHPFYLIENKFGYRSQWLQDSWKGLPGNFKDGHHWYARTLEDWIKLISTLPHTSFELREIINDSENPLSLLFIIKK